MRSLVVPTRFLQEGSRLGRVLNLDILTQASAARGGVIVMSDRETQLDRSDTAAPAIDL